MPAILIGANTVSQGDWVAGSRVGRDGYLMIANTVIDNRPSYLSSYTTSMFSKNVGLNPARPQFLELPDRSNRSGYQWQNSSAGTSHFTINLTGTAWRILSCYHMTDTASSTMTVRISNTTQTIDYTNYAFTNTAQLFGGVWLTYAVSGPDIRINFDAVVGSRSICGLFFDPLENSGVGSGRFGHFIA